MRIGLNWVLKNQWPCGYRSPARAKLGAKARRGFNLLIGTQLYDRYVKHACVVTILFLQWRPGLNIRRAGAYPPRFAPASGYLACRYSRDEVRGRDGASRETFEIFQYHPRVLRREVNEFEVFRRQITHRPAAHAV